MTISPGAAAPLEAARYREVMANYPTGVTVVTGLDSSGDPLGMVVGTFTAVSLDPPLVAFLPAASSTTYASLRLATSYCINVLAHDQLDLCRAMSVSRPNKFDLVAWNLSEHGAPMLSDAVAHIHCRPQQEIAAGDHFVVLCEVQGLEVNRPVTPLLFFQGGYGGFSSTGLAAKGDVGLIAALRLAEVARPQIERLADTLDCESAVLVVVNDDEFTTACSVFGGDAHVMGALGMRMPLMPPFGEVFVAWNPEREDRYLSRASNDEVAIEDFRNGLAAVRDCGYTVANVPSELAGEFEELIDALGDYAFSDLTPARDRAIRSVIAEKSHLFEPFEIEDSDRYDIRVIGVPVHDPDEGGVSLVIRLA
jgi:flavin reductase (DIM6/NTAB) family NADH-FMN oxidoreductase RutF